VLSYPGCKVRCPEGCSALTDSDHDWDWDLDRHADHGAISGDCGVDDAACSGSATWAYPGVSFRRADQMSHEGKHPSLPTRLKGVRSVSRSSSSPERRRRVALIAPADVALDLVHLEVFLSSIRRLCSSSRGT
jgi:hypothetical protein